MHGDVVLPGPEWKEDNSDAIALTTIIPDGYHLGELTALAASATLPRVWWWHASSSSRSSGLWSFVRSIFSLSHTHAHLPIRLQVVTVLNAYPDIRLGAQSAEDVADLLLVINNKSSKETTPEQEEEEDENYVPQTSGVIKVVGSIPGFAVKLEEEYTKSLRQISPHTPQYIVRLKDESPLVGVAALVRDYCCRVEDWAGAASVALVELEHTYYQHESIAAAVSKSQDFTNQFGNPGDLHPGCMSGQGSSEDVTKCHPASFLGTPSVESRPVDYTEEVRKLATFLYKYGDDRQKTRAMLCHIFHHALHDRFYPARDLLLMSHLQETISMTDISTQILYNRMMVNLGLCAFRLGLIQDAHDCLRDVCSSRVKELLAQGVQQHRYQEKAPEVEKAERRRQTPFHMHINLELLECCHMTSAMLREVPNMAQEKTQLRKWVLSKVFRRQMEYFDLQVFSGPPEMIRDHVIAGGKALMQGDWEKCADYILNLDVWNLIPGEGVAERVKEMLREKIQIEGLRTYLFTYASSYDSLSLPQLCKMFGLDRSQAHSIISKMMINQDIYGSWDQPTETIVLQKVEPTRLQMLALQFAEKVRSLPLLPLFAHPLPLPLRRHTCLASVIIQI